jgi:hypothetical protein
MVADGMLTRKRYREVPPRVDYELTDRSRDLMPTLGALARWGYEWAWSAPRPGENIDIGAIFRLSPGLLDGDARLGTVELTVIDPAHEGGMTHSTVTVAPTGVTIAERAAPDANARVAATEPMWIRALSPSHDRSGLEIVGDQRLAAQLLDGLSIGSGEATHAATAGAA